MCIEYISIPFSGLSVFRQPCVCLRGIWHIELCHYSWIDHSFSEHLAASWLLLKTVRYCVRRRSFSLPVPHIQPPHWACFQSC